MDFDRSAILNAQPDPARPYVYDGTRVLINKFGILNVEVLDRVCRSTTQLRSKLLSHEPISGNFDLDRLRAIHRYLFQDVYTWAGDLRIIDMQLDSIGFTPVAELMERGSHLCRALVEDPEIDSRNKVQFSARIAYHLTELLVLHPFRDGNGRAIRVFFMQFVAAKGWRLDFDPFPRAELGEACFAARCGNFQPLQFIVAAALTDCRS